MMQPTHTPALSPTHAHSQTTYCACMCLWIHPLSRPQLMLNLVYTSIIGFDSSDEVALMSLILSILGIIINVAIILGCYKYSKPAFKKFALSMEGKFTNILRDRNGNEIVVPTLRPEFSKRRANDRSAKEHGINMLPHPGASDVGTGDAHETPRLCASMSSNGPCSAVPKQGSQYCDKHLCPGDGCTKNKSSSAAYCPTCTNRLETPSTNAGEHVQHGLWLVPVSVPASTDSSKAKAAGRPSQRVVENQAHVEPEPFSNTSVPTETKKKSGKKKKKPKKKGNRAVSGAASNTFTAELHFPLAAEGAVEFEGAASNTASTDLDYYSEFELAGGTELASYEMASTDHAIQQAGSAELDFYDMASTDHTIQQASGTALDFYDVASPGGAASNTTTSAFDHCNDTSNNAFEGDYDALPDALVLDVYGDHPCAYVSARGHCKTVVTRGAKFCAKHSCPSCTSSKPSKSVRCPACATRSITIAGHADEEEFGGFMDA